MAARAGYGGSVTAAGKTAGVRAWAVTKTADELDITTFSSGSVAEYTTGITRWRGTLAALWDGTDTIDVGDSVVLTLLPGTGGTGTLSGTGKITEIAYSTTHDGLVEAPITFVGSGALSTT